ncbi:hypothetical protein SERLADRAFT_396999 [Serpula lacrymans var. lacrymans S7.9]|uniref:Uncharacterized protein n=1 Tax=Serpula lacrymans var. lacrymans (strain S7.9) TaxID=578457 RepID=F8P537_SERL9|nr:uncharacterized protein SERLADRAFT_396999 [Serpula lacrymans var. lacrymans S7.9]EGO21724.1 hypothetical protein SERLADRAFT_396999 [Serpula lacrymans var. lacrymans S7.9]
MARDQKRVTSVIETTRMERGSKSKQKSKKRRTKRERKGGTLKTLNRHQANKRSETKE